jgi:predicted MFS family arabinose efflux permease
MPLYFQEVRHDSVSLAGALVGPQGVGAALTMWWSGRRMDRHRTEHTIMLGVLLMALATAVLAMLGPHPAGWVAPTAMFVRGLGVGLCMLPTMVTALAVVPAASISDASPLLNVIQQLGAAIGTALFAVVLARATAGAPHPLTSAGLAGAFSTANWWAVGVTAFAGLPCLVLMRVSRRRGAHETALTEGAVAEASAALPG